MKAIGYRQAGPIDRADSPIDTDLPEPVATGRDLLVEVRAVSVNPVDVKVRGSAAPTGEGPRVLGWDAAGVVRAIGPEVMAFHPGDEVFYAGNIALIDDPDTLDAVPFKRKSVSIHWELMFTRPLYATADLGAQGRLLAEVAGLVDAGRLRTTATERLSPVDAATLKHAHAMVESGAMRGKVVLAGWA